MHVHARTHAPTRGALTLSATPPAGVGKAFARSVRLTPKAGTLTGAFVWPAPRARSTIEACGGNRGNE